MRPLNRPMFRYGGPIKEGVMSGIREPKKNGGLSKQFNTGLVGDERYPKTDGREHHVAFLAPLAWAARFAPAAYRGFKAARAYAPWSKNLGKWGRTKDIFLPKKSLTAPMAASGEGAGFATGAFMRANPVTSFGIASMVPQAGYAGYKVAKAAPGTAWEGAKRWADMVVPGDQSRWWKDKEPITNIEKPGGFPDKKIKKVDSKAPPPGKSDEQIRKDRIQKYRDIMDIKSMNKEAAANSLIEASRLINESQDFKGDIKSGSLINKIIQGASKAFDKPADTKKAIDTLILKGEIEKDIKADDPSNKMLNELRLLQGKKIQKELNPSFNTLKAGYAKDNKGQSGIDLAAAEFAANNGVDFKGNIISKTDFKDILKDLKTKTKGIDEDVIIKNYTEEIIKNQNAPDGAYTVGDKIVVIEDKQVIAVE